MRRTITLSAVSTLLVSLVACDTATAPNHSIVVHRGHNSESGLAALQRELAVLEHAQADSAFRASMSFASSLPHADLATIIASLEASEIPTSLQQSLSLARTNGMQPERDGFVNCGYYAGRTYSGSESIRTDYGSPPGARLIQYYAATDLGGAWNDADEPRADVEWWQQFSNGQRSAGGYLYTSGTAPYASTYDEVELSGDPQTGYMSGSHYFFASNVPPGYSFESPYCQVSTSHQV
jgi:hypothetical protein